MFGLKNTGFLAFDEKETPAAYYGVFPIQMTINGIDYLVAQSADTMTDPDHRNKGLFVQLAKQTYDFSRENGVQFVFGFPNQNSFPGFQKKLEWEFYGNLYDFFLDIKTLPLCGLAARYKWMKPLYNLFSRVRLLSIKLNYSAENIAPFAQNNAVGYITKNEAFFQYKKAPDIHLVRLNGITLFVKTDGMLIIGDVSPFNPERSGDLILTVRQLAKMLGCRKIIFSVTQNHWLFPLLSAYTSGVESLPVGYLRFDTAFPFDKIAFTRADYDTF